MLLRTPRLLEGGEPQALETQSPVAGHLSQGSPVVLVGEGGSGPKEVGASGWRQASESVPLARGRAMVTWCDTGRPSEPGAELLPGLCSGARLGSGGSSDVLCCTAPPVPGQCTTHFSNHVGEFSGHFRPGFQDFQLCSMEETSLVQIRNAA